MEDRLHTAFQSKPQTPVHLTRPQAGQIGRYKEIDHQGGGIQLPNKVNKPCAEISARFPIEKTVEVKAKWCAVQWCALPYHTKHHASV